MIRNFGIGTLIVLFCLSSVNLGLAAQVLETPSVVAQPYDLGAINQQMIELDLENQHQLAALQGILSENQKLTNTFLAPKQNVILEKINNAMATSQRVSDYDELINLEEDVDDMKNIGKTLQQKRDVIEQKSKILTDLKDEMVSLNKKLSGEAPSGNMDQIEEQQGAKIQMLAQSLGETDQKIGHYDEIIAEKDRQILQLKDDLARVQDEASIKDQLLRKQKYQIEILRGQSNDIALHPTVSLELPPIYVSTSDNEEQAAPEPGPAPATNIELPPIIVNAPNLGPQVVAGPDPALALAAKDKIIKEQEDQMAILKVQAQELSSKVEFLRTQADQMVKASSSEKTQSFSAGNANLQAQVLVLNEKIQQQALDLKAKIESIRWLNQVLDAAKSKAEYYQLSSQQDKLSVANTQEEMRDVKENFAQRSKDYARLDNDILSLKSQVSLLGLQLIQKSQQVDLLRSELENKIAEQKSQSVLARQIKDLKTQLQDRDERITALKAKLQAGQGGNQDLDALKQQLAAQQDKADQLKQQLDSKTTQADQLTLMLNEYQKKLESKDNAFNGQWGQILAFKNYQIKMDKQVADLNTRLQEKEAQVIKIKEALYELQKSSSAKDSEYQAKDLSLSILQQRLKDEKLLRMPDSDEVNFLRAGFKQATMQLEQKDALLHQVQANADEYQKEFKDQSLEFQSLKDQLRDARAEIALIKDHSPANVKDLRAQLKKANAEIKDLQTQLDQLRSVSSNSPLEEKLTQALNKMIEQGQVINTLTQKLQDCQQGSNSTKDSPSNTSGVQKSF